MNRKIDAQALVHQEHGKLIVSAVKDVSEMKGQMTEVVKNTEQWRSQTNLFVASGIKIGESADLSKIKAADDKAAKKRAFWQKVRLGVVAILIALGTGLVTHFWEH